MALEIESGDSFTSKELIDAIWGAVSKLYGEHGASKTSLALVDFEAEKKFAVLRSTNVALPMVRSALASITNIGNKPAAMHVLAVSGTLKALYKKTRK
ncbi:MAG: Rpp14/Pop5 family protein [Candidatus Bathyarchaeia archaeon]